VRRETNKYWEGDGTVYEALAAHINLSSAAAIGETEKYIDLRSAANYLMLMSYLSGFDWDIDHNSLCGGHTTLNVVPYKFILWDTDLALGNGGLWDPDKSGDATYFEAPVDKYGPVPPGLVGHDEFDLMMADALQCACFDNGILTANKADSLYLHRARQIDTALIAESARWGDLDFTAKGNTDVDNWEVFVDWNAELNRMRNSYLPQRRVNLINHFKTNNIYPSIEPVAYSHEGGIVPNNFQLSMTNLEGSGTIYFTMDGSDPRSYGGGVNNSASIYSSSINLPDGVYDIKARVKSGSIWSAMCPKRFYVGQEYDKVVINEIHYHPPDSVTPTNDTIEGKEFEFIELKNTGTSTVTLTDIEFNKGIRWVFSEETDLPAGGFLILAEDANNFQSKYGIAADYIYTGKLDNGGEKIQLVKPDKTLLDEVRYNDKLPWNPIPDSSNYSLALIDPDYDNDSPVNWTTQSTYFTPKAENLFNGNPYPDYSDLVINEIHYHPNDSLISGDGERFEFIEIKNKGSETVYLADVEFNQGVLLKFDDTISIPPYGFLIVAKDSSLLLQNLFGDTIDLVSYDHILPWPLVQQDHAIGLIQESLDNQVGSNWSIQNKKTTTHATNTFDCIITLNELNMPLLDSRTVKAGQEIITNGFVPGPEQVSYQSGLSIEMEPSFEVKLGAIFEAKIGACN
jgi:hypothetical protein